MWRRATVTADLFRRKSLRKNWIGKLTNNGEKNNEIKRDFTEK